MTSTDANRLSPFSPAANNATTPDESTSTLSFYESPFSEPSEDPFFGVDFSSAEGGVPAFFDDPVPGLEHVNSFGQSSTLSSSPPTTYATNNSSTYPLSPEQTASIHTASPCSDRRILTRPAPPRIVDSVSPQELQLPFKPSPITTQSSISATQLTPSLSGSGSGRSSEDGLAPAAMAPPGQSPRISVSMWGKDNETQIHGPEQNFAPADQGSPGTVRGGSLGFGSGAMPLSDGMERPTSAPREGSVKRKSPSPNGRRGLAPEDRPDDELEASPNEMLTKREVEEKNREVDKWLDGNLSDHTPGARQSVDRSSAVADDDEDDGIPTQDIPLGDQTENKVVDGQVYFHSQIKGEMAQADRDMILETRNWGNSPMIREISNMPEQRIQPETANAAMTRWNKMADNESIASKAATWGTRRRSLPEASLLDVEIATTGNLLQKLTINRAGARRPSLIKELRGLVRKPSFNAPERLKRAFSNHDEDGFRASEVNNEKRSDSIPHLTPQNRSSSWGLKKPPTPSINTAFVAIGGSMASIGGGNHARNGSISATPITSPKSAFPTLKVTPERGRPRAKSDLSKSVSGGPGTHPNLVTMWKKSGGPPVSALAKPITGAEFDDDDDDDDDGFDEGDLKAEQGKIDDITPTFAGFQQHVLRLNPSLESTNNYLVDRIAHQQVVRYKSLLNNKVKHLGLGAACACGPLCIALGGSANILDQRGDPRSADPVSAGFGSSDGDITPTEGVISQESFPNDIPMPPTNTLPAEFECQLCFQSKKFQKPSDWTKHVHEDVQPFTCTWDRCRDPKMFKRKADWVRHENEGHRHLEWWTCDVDDCHHTCYRRDNFLQHLVREHKFPEPKVKTKAALKKAGGGDPTWQKVEKCHADTDVRPQDEPCRFCGKTFPTWKKLTVHLAKHMEHISLPVLRLVAAKELDADTIISPVQDPPPRPFVPLPGKREQQQSQYPMQPQFTSMMPPQQPAGLMHQSGLAYSTGAQGGYGFPVMSNMASLPNMSGMPTVPSAQTYQQPYFNPGYDSIDTSLSQPDVYDHTLSSTSQSFHHQQPQFPGLPVTNSGFVSTQNHFTSMPQDAEPFPALNTNSLGLQTSPTHLGGPIVNHLTPQMGSGMASQMGYDSLMDHSSNDGYTPQGSVSPFQRSPHQGQGGFYSTQ